MIAEIGVNHNGDPELAMQMLDAAAAAGADAVKFQAFTPERLVARKVDAASNQKDDNTNLLDLLRRLDLPDDAYPRLMERCRQKGVEFLCTPFDEERTDFLKRMGVNGFKIGSGEITDLAFLKHVGSQKRPIILSSGMSTFGETALAIEALQKGGAHEIALLHCLSSYPADPREANLKALKGMQAAFGLPVGFSDHSNGDILAIAACALGATIIEKHFTLDQKLPGPDQCASTVPEEYKSLVRNIRILEEAMGDGIKRPAPGEANLRTLARRSLATERDIPAGTLLGADDLITLRPAKGISLNALNGVIGRRVNKDIAQGTIVHWKDLE